MTNVADATPVPGQASPPAPRTSIRGLFAQTEIDLRLFGMLIALIVILLTFHVLSGGKLISPTNMVTMAIQATGIAIIATGMVLVIVSRNIDLSVGSLLGFLGYTMALVQTDGVIAFFGLDSDGLHGPNEHYSIAMFERGIATSIAFLEEAVSL